MFRAWSEHLQALRFGTPLQNVDIDVANAPAFHFEPCGLVKVDGVRADQRRSIIVDDVFVLRSGNLEPRSEREARPIRCSADHVSSGEILAERIVPPTAL